MLYDKRIGEERKQGYLFNTYVYMYKYVLKIGKNTYDNYNLHFCNWENGHVGFYSAFFD
jgi:hypothetical protein